MKYKRLAALLLTAGLLMNLCACKPQEVEPEIPEEPPVDPNFPIVLELSGETITIQEAPNCIASLSPAITELFCDWVKILF